MRFERLLSDKDPKFQKAMELYGISFPQHEQRLMTSQRRILGDKDYHFTLIYENDVFVGIVLFWETGEFIYVEHFCILPELRNKGCGQKALNLLEKKEKMVILEIDLPEDDVSVHRKAFYEKNGFSENPFPHIHPPYLAENKGHRLIIMSCPNRITQTEYNNFKDYLQHRVMKNVFV